MALSQTAPAPDPRKMHGSIMITTESIPWIPFALEGTFFKPLHLDDDQGKATILLRVPAGAPAAIHKHLAAVEAYVVQGSFSYEGEGSVGPGDYVYEPGGMVHEPIADEGCDLILFVVSQGSIVGIQPDGTLAGIIDNDLIYELALAAGAHRHLKRNR
jgi:2,4'-dihydroxyacetophenone dioxygenase